MKIAAIAILAVVGSQLLASATLYSCNFVFTYQTNITNNPATADLLAVSGAFKTSWEALHPGEEYEMPNNPLLGCNSHDPVIRTVNLFRDGGVAVGSSYWELLQAGGGVGCTNCTWDDDGVRGMITTKMEKDWIETYVGSTQNHLDWVNSYCDELSQALDVFEDVYSMKEYANITLNCNNTREIDEILNRVEEAGF